MRLRPDLVLVKLAPVSVPASGLILAPAIVPEPCIGKAVQVGSAVTDVKVGDVVIVPPDAGEPIAGLFRLPHLLVSEAQIAAIIEREGV